MNQSCVYKYPSILNDMIAFSFIPLKLVLCYFLPTSERSKGVETRNMFGSMLVNVENISSEIP